ncbi:MAG: DUF4468 domain-containing protein [Bacteroidota bacterium]
MKMKLLLASLSFIYITSFAQTAAPKLPVDESTKLITYTKVVELNGAGKDSLYNKALKWCNSYFKNPGEVIREKDQEAGKIICKPRFKVMNPENKEGVATDGGIVQYTLTLQFKDGRYKYVMTEFNWKQASNYPVEKWMDVANDYYKPEYSYYLKQVDDKVSEIVSSLQQGMNSKGEIKKDDW